jgi:hypothetical protein
MGILIGDGQLNYRPETIMESYYSVALQKNTTLTFDYQLITNPAYNADRGPVSIFSARLTPRRGSSADRTDGCCAIALALLSGVSKLSDASPHAGASRPRGAHTEDRRKSGVWLDTSDELAKVRKKQR